MGAEVCDTGCTYFRNGCILSALDKQIKHLTQKQSVASAQGREERPHIKKTRQNERATRKKAAAATRTTTIKQKYDSKKRSKSKLRYQVRN